MINLTAKKANSPIEILLVGDTSFGENYQMRRKKAGIGNILEERGYDYPLEKVKSALTTADLVIANLETPLTDLTESPYEGQKAYVHWSDIQKCPTRLLKHNIKVVSLANNHTFDYGLEGFEQTLSTLEKNKISYFGAGKDEEAAASPLLISAKTGQQSVKIAMIGAFQGSRAYRERYNVYAGDTKKGVNPLDTKKIANTVKQLKQEDPNTFVIVFPHWGANYEWKNNKQIETSDELIAAGVDLIVGHGAHMMQEIEKINDRWVLYSIGNFMFNSPGRYNKMNAPPFSFATKLIIKPGKEKPELSLKLYPIVTDNLVTEFQPRFTSDFEFNEVLNQLIIHNSSQATLLNTLKRDQDNNGYYLEMPITHDHTETHDTKWVGLICNIIRWVDPNLFPQRWLPRAMAMDEELQRHDMKLLIFNYKNANLITKKVPGYYLENNKLIYVESEIPQINHKDYVRKIKPTEITNDLKQVDFIDWAKRNNITVFSDLLFSRIISDKYKCFLLTDEFQKNLHPYTEKFKWNTKQVESFLKRFNTVFLKPKKGSMGLGILIIRRNNNGFQVTDNKNRSKYFEEIQEFIKTFRPKSEGKSYIIQKGIDIIKYKNRAFDIRVISTYDGKEWVIIHKARVGQQKSEISNLHQGGSIKATEETLEAVFNKESSEKIIKNIIKTSKGLCKYIEDKYPNSTIEIAFDFLVDKNQNIYIAEINTNPGITTPNKIKNAFDMNPKQLADYKKYIVPHGRALALGLLSKLNKQRKQVKEHQTEIWFDSDIKNPIQNINITGVMHYITGKESGLSSVDNHSNQNSIVFITACHDYKNEIVNMGSGENIKIAIDDALKKFDNAVNFKDTNIKLDIVTDVDIIKNANITKALKFNHSLEGLAFDKSSGIAFLPEELISKRLINKKMMINKNNTSKYAKKSRNFSKEFKEIYKQKHSKIFLFKTKSYYYDEKNTTQLYRGHRKIEKPQKSQLIESAVDAGNYLLRALDDNGKFIYSYYPRSKKISEKYNILRHAGTIYSMLELFEATNNAKLLTSAKLALDYLIQQTKTKSDGNNVLRFVIEDDYIKLGGNALTALALAKYIQLTQEKENLTTLKELGNWIISAQDETGQFYIHKLQYSTNKNTDFVSGYYPGEAIFALTRIYQIDPQEKWLDTAENAAKYLINVRDKGLAIDNIAHDHWLLYGLNELYRLRQNDIYFDHAKKIGKSIVQAQLRDPEFDDWRGGFRSPPPSTPTAIRMEGLCALYHMINDFGEDKDLTKKQILESLQLGIAFQLQTQFQPESVMYLPDKEFILGGFKQGYENFEIRIDYVQHNISSILGLYRIMRMQPNDES